MLLIACSPIHRFLLLYVVMYPHMSMPTCTLLFLLPIYLAHWPAVLGYHVSRQCVTVHCSLGGSGGMLSPGLFLLLRVSEVDSDAI